MEDIAKKAISMKDVFGNDLKQTPPMAWE